MLPTITAIIKHSNKLFCGLLGDGNGLQRNFLNNPVTNDYSRKIMLSGSLAVRSLSYVKISQEVT
jgi:hypothetical protein